MTTDSSMPKWPEDKRSHLDPVFFEEKNKWMKTDREQRAFGLGFNLGADECKKAFEEWLAKTYSDLKHVGHHTVDEELWRLNPICQPRLL